MDLSYIEMAHKILSLYFTDFDREDLLKLIEKSYSTFEDEIVKVAYQKDYYLELYHGRTSAFKDFALCLLPNLLAYAKKSLGIKEKTLILTATSGDTGKAALEGFYNTEDIDILVLYPTEGVSDIQKLQMDSTGSLNSKVIAIEGNFDDAQTAVKKIFNDEGIKEELKKKNTYLSSANSINIGRLLPQIVYYFYSYANLVNNQEIKCGDKVTFCVPTGNFGDILAGFYAKQMGLSVDKLVIASNDNNVLTDFFTTGTYDANRDLIKTISPSMDILVSSNLERLIYHKSSDKVVKEKMNDLKEKGVFRFEGDFSEFLAGFANKEETEKTINKVYEDEGYLIDPHTSVANAVADKLGLEKTMILSTASPYKFASSVLKALGENPSDDKFENIKALYEKTKVKIPSEIRKLEGKKIIHQTKIKKDQIAGQVLKFAGRGRRISVPATSANMGPGFDALGMALGLYNTCEFRPTNDYKKFSYLAKENLIYQAYKYTFDFYKEKPVPVYFDIDADIPVARGLGSSAACIVMGLMAAFDVMGRDFDKKEILQIATEIEGHPDNVAPALFGGSVISILGNEEVYLKKFSISDKFKFLAIIPEYRLSTQEARGVLPETYPKADAVFNMGRIAMLVLSLESGDIANLKVALEDKIHQPYRFGLIPEIEKIEKIIKESGAIGSYLSGAGSTIMLVLERDDDKSEKEIREKLGHLANEYDLKALEIDKNGAFLI